MVLTLPASWILVVFVSSQTHCTDLFESIGGSSQIVGQYHREKAGFTFPNNRLVWYGSMFESSKCPDIITHNLQGCNNGMICLWPLWLIAWTTQCQRYARAAHGQAQKPPTHFMILSALQKSLSFRASHLPLSVLFFCHYSTLTEGWAGVSVCEKGAKCTDQVWIAPGVISEPAWRAKTVFLFLLVCDMWTGSCDVLLTGLCVQTGNVCPKGKRNSWHSYKNWKLREGRRGGFWDGTKGGGVGGTKGWAETVLHFPRALTANTNFRR